MKKIFSVACTFLVLVALSVSLFGCEFSRKMNGAETQFGKRVAAAEQLSFNMTVQCADCTVELKCFKKGSQYAYVYNKKDIAAPVYRELYTDNRLYQVLECNDELDVPIIGSVPVGIGEYYIEENTPAECEENFIYTVTKYVMCAGYVTLISSATAEKLGEITAYRYDFENNGDSYKIWFDENNMIKVCVEFAEGERYTLEFSNYKFTDVETKYFVKPEDTVGLYMQSRFSAQEWVSIINDFSTTVSTSWVK